MMRLNTKGISIPSLVFGIVLVAFSLAFFFTRGFGLLDLHPRQSLNDYQWGELKAIATAIAKAESDEEGLEIAKQYNLCLEDGTIDPENTKTFSLANGAGKRTVQIIGFRHDVKQSGNEAAGITFCFRDPIEKAPINTNNDGTATNAGGWEESSGRELVASYIHEPALKTDEFPIDLARLLVKVKKQAAGTGSEGARIPTIETEDKVFLLSYSEIFGNQELENATEDGIQTLINEGNQYQLFTEAKNASTIRSSFASKSYPIWLRSAFSANQTDFMVLTKDGAISHMPSNESCSIIVAFCL